MSLKVDDGENTEACCSFMLINNNMIKISFKFEKNMMNVPKECYGLQPYHFKAVFTRQVALSEIVFFWEIK